MKDHSIYIHLPFCASKCPYCDFNSIATNHPPFMGYQKALSFEWQQMRSVLSSPPVSVYIGGGTPSVWPAKRIVELLSEVIWKEGAEVTVEVNPGSLRPSWLKALKEAGVNRISIGVQALSDIRLATLGRKHSAQEARKAIETSLSIGFRSISADIIYGTVGHSESMLREELTQLAGMGIHHISAYELTLSENTPMGRNAASGKESITDDDQLVKLWNVVRETLVEHEIFQYEVSNYAKQGHTSRHNRHYWSGGGYIGLGASAHGFIKTPHKMFRYSNLTDPADYISAKRGKKGRFQFETLDGMAASEALSQLDHAREQAMLGLRTIYGFPFQTLVQTIPMEEQVKWHRAASSIINSGLGVHSDGRLIPTPSGLLQADTIAEEFF